jgi:HD-GYP domain-containing protein (c-di-GMP phosphodiesterase class II)
MDDDDLVRKQMIRLFHRSEKVDPLIAESAIGRAFSEEKDWGKLLSLVMELNSGFEDFIAYAVKAIEERDPPSVGHSGRVASLCVKIAENLGTFVPHEIKTLEYAANLHDIGKIYIDNAILDKSHKLHAASHSRIQLSLDYMYRYQELNYIRHELRVHTYSLRKKVDQSIVIRDLHEEREKTLNNIRKIKKDIASLNSSDDSEPMDQDALSRVVKELNILKCLDIDDVQMHPLSAEDIRSLAKKKGTRTEAEQDTIEKHVLFTNRIVKEVHWPDHLKLVPQIAMLHHERLDGSGYPFGVDGESIPISARILMVADMFDALTGKDRFYRNPASIRSALAALETEAASGKIDSSIVASLRSVMEETTHSDGAASFEKGLYQ